MLLPKEILEEFDELMSRGKTEKAIVLLQKSLRNRKNLPPKLVRQITLLSGQYHNWEDEKMSGIKQDSAEFNRINRELLILADNLRHPGEQSQPYNPPPQPSPDPLGVVYQQPQAPHPRPAAEKSGGMMKYLTWFFVGLGVLAFVGLLMEMGNEEYPETEPSGMDTEVIQPANGTPPAPSTATPQNIVPPATKPQVSPPAETLPSMTKAIADRMKQLMESGEELSEDDLLAINPQTLKNHFGNSSWYDHSWGYLNFDPTGSYGTYAQGNATLQIVYQTTYGFYIGQYAEPMNGDQGLLAIAPPGAGEPLTVYSESQVNEAITGFWHLSRQ